MVLVQELKQAVDFETKNGKFLRKKLLFCFQYWEQKYAISDKEANFWQIQNFLISGQYLEKVTNVQFRVHSAHQIGMALTPRTFMEH